jgi:hypothetical protein
MYGVAAYRANSVRKAVAFVVCRVCFDGVVDRLPAKALTYALYVLTVVLPNTHDKTGLVHKLNRQSTAAKRGHVNTVDHSSQNLARGQANGLTTIAANPRLAIIRFGRRVVVV